MSVIRTRNRNVYPPYRSSFLILHMNSIHIYFIFSLSSFGHPSTQSSTKIGLQLCICKTQFILVLLFITILFFMWTTVNPLLPHAVHWQTITFHRAVTPSKRPQHWPWPWPPALHLMVSRNEKADRFWLYHVSGTHPYTHKISKKQAFADHFL